VWIAARLRHCPLHSLNGRFPPDAQQRRTLDIDISVQTVAATITTITVLLPQLLSLLGGFEPWGTALFYLAGGAPAVVGNLWDVTDRDIDRFSIAVLQSWAGQGGDIARAVQRSRGACNLSKAVGAAPVVYGMPTHASPTVPQLVGSPDGDFVT
jgi:peptidase C50-like protein